MSPALSEDWLPWVGAIGGLAVGSFLNTAALALAGGPSPWRMRSACPACGHRLAWYELVPLLSFLVLRGRCRHCHGRISPLYPAGELAAGVAVGLTLWRWGAGTTGLTTAAFCLVLLVCALVDAWAGLVPDVVVLPAAGVALGLAPWLPLGSWAAALAGAGVTAGVLWLVAFLFRLARGREGLGLGDVKLGLLMGAFLGWPGAMLAVGLGAAAGLGFYLVLLALGRVAWDSELPFAPFLALGGGAMALFGPEALVWLGEGWAA